MPGQTGEAVEIMKFIAEDVSKDTYVNVMEQYRVVHQGFTHFIRQLSFKADYPSTYTVRTRFIIPLISRLCLFFPAHSEDSL